MNPMSLKLTRREVALALGSVALAAQTPPTAQTPLPSNPDEELKAVRETIQQNIQQLAKVDLPMATEPAVHFHP